MGGLVDEKVPAIVDAPVYTLTHEQINDGFVMDLGKLKPFGMGNEKPMFRIPDVTLREIKKFGKAKEHVELVIENFKDKDGSQSTARPDFLNDVHLYSETHRRVSPVRYISFFSDKHIMMHPQIRFSIFMGTSRKVSFWVNERYGCE